MLKKLERILNNILNFYLNHPRKILISSLVLILFLALQVPKLKVYLSISDTVGEQVPAAVLTKKIKEEFELGHKLLIHFQSNEKEMSYAQACAIYQWLKNETDKNFSIKSVQSPFRLRKIVSLEKSLWFEKVIDNPCLEKDGANKFKEELAKLRVAATGDFFVSERDKDLFVQLEFEETNTGKFGNFDPLIYENIIPDIEKLKSNNLKISIVGDMSFLYWVTVGIKWYNKLNFIFLFFLLLLFRYFYGSWRGGILLIINFLVSGIFLYGLMSLFNVRVDTLSNGLFLLMSVAALEDFIFLSEKKSEGKNTKETFSSLIVPGFFTSLTTVIGFGSLCFTSMPMIFKFGFWSAIGAVIEFCVTFLLMPVFITRFKFFENWVDINKARSKKTKFIPILKKALPPSRAKIILLIGFLGVFGFKYFNIEMDAVKYFPENHEYFLGSEEVFKLKGWKENNWLIFEKNAIKNDILVKIKKLKQIVKIEGKDQILEDAIKNENAERAELISALYKSTDLYKKYQREHERVLLYLNIRSTKELNLFENEVKKICGNNCQLASDSITLAQLSTEVASILQSSFVSSLLLIFGLVFILGKLKGIDHLWPLMLGSFWGPFVVIGLIALFQIPINHMSSVFVGVIIGLTGDNAIQYIFSGEKKILHSMESKAYASLQIMFFMIAASSIFQFTYFVPPRRLGLLLIIGFITSLIGDYWLTRSLIKKDETQS